MTPRETLVTVISGAGLPAYPLSVPEGGSYPCVVYQYISGRQIRSHAGGELERARLQLSCWGLSFETAQSTAETVKAALDLNQDDYLLATRENELDLKEVEPGYYRIVLDYFIWTGGN